MIFASSVGLFIYLERSRERERKKEVNKWARERKPFDSVNQFKRARALRLGSPYRKKGRKIWRNAVANL